MPPATPPTAPQPPHVVRVQLQQQDGPGNTIHHDSQVIVGTDAAGVYSSEVVEALRVLRVNSGIPSGEQRAADAALSRAIQWVLNRPPAGLSGQVSRSFYFRPQTPSSSWRFDIENIRGQNLQR